MPTKTMIPAALWLLAMFSIVPEKVSTADCGPSALTVSVRTCVTLSGDITSPTIEIRAMIAGKRASTP